MLFSKPRKTVASVIAGFTAVLNDLDQVVGENRDIIAENDEAVVALVAESSAAGAEVDRAQRIRSKLAAIVEG